MQPIKIGSGAVPRGVHLGCEGEFAFPTAGGKVRVAVTGDTLTPYGGLVPWAAFTRHLGVFERLAASAPVVRTSPNAAPVYDVVQSFALTALTDGRRFAHIERLREDPAVPELFGLAAVVSDDTVRRFFASVDPAVGAEWIAACAAPLWQALPARIIADWDDTVQPKYGRQEGTAVGYNPAKPGRRSLHPLMAVVAGTRLCPAYRFRAGDTVTATQWQQAMADAQRWLGGRSVWLNRGDVGLGHEAVMRWHEVAADRPEYLFKLKLSPGVRRAALAVPEADWQGPATLGAWQVAEVQLRLFGWSQARRVVLARRRQGAVSAAQAGAFWDEVKHEYAAYVTSLPAVQCNAWQVVALYRERADTENVFDELKNQWGFSGFCGHQRAITELAARLLLLVYNLWVLFVRFLQPQAHVEAGRGRRWFLLIAARLVERGRQKEMQLAISGGWLEQLKDGYLRLHEWIRSTAPQLQTAPPVWSATAPTCA
jgi:hypothetical protein